MRRHIRPEQEHCERIANPRQPNRSKRDSDPSNGRAGPDDPGTAPPSMMELVLTSQALASRRVRQSPRRPANAAAQTSMPRNSSAAAKFQARYENLAGPKFRPLSSAEFQPSHPQLQPQSFPYVEMCLAFPSSKKMKFVRLAEDRRHSPNE